MAVTRKITLEVPSDLLDKAQQATGSGVTETVRAGLRLLAASEAYERLLRSGGTWKTGLSWQELKYDR